MPLMNAIQVVLQHPSSTGGRCRAFTGLPVSTPAWLLVEGASSADDSAAEDLAEEVAKVLCALGPQVREVVAPCRGSGFRGCHALDEPDCTKVHVPVFSAGRHAGAYPRRWPSGAPHVDAFPVVVGVSTQQLPADLQREHVVSWQRGQVDSVIDLLQRVGLVSAQRRLFISYVRADADALTEQLFEALVKRRFEVFVDRFRIEPGANFQVRLQEELGRMGTVLVIESRGLRRSTWVQHEVNFARKHNLGLLALHMPRAPRTAGIAADARLGLGAADVQASGKLSTDMLTDVVHRVEVAHARAERVRLAYLRDNVSRELALAGFHTQGFGLDGVVVARRAFAEHAFRVSNLPAELTDFQTLDAYRLGRTSLRVVAPGLHMSWRTRAPIDWLSRVSRIDVHDPAEVQGVVGGL